MSAARKKQQWLMVGVIVAILGFIFFIASNILGRSPQSLVSSAAGGRIDTRIVADRTSGASPEDIWISNAEVQIGELTQQIIALRREVEASQQRADTAVENLQSQFTEKVTSLEGETASAVMDLAGRINKTASELASQVVGNPLEETRVSALDLGANGPREFVARDAGFAQARADLDPGAGTTAGEAGSQTLADSTLGEFDRAPFVTSFALTPKLKGPKGIKKRGLDRYVPAGSYAPAVVLTGADAKTGTENLANPIPVILKLTGPAIGPADGSRTTRINLEGCRVMGAAVADLSSERVSVRLDAISCVRGGQVLEAKVAGYVSGQGQQGVRGRLFSRAGPAISNAAIASALEGVAGAASGTGQALIGLESATSGDVTGGLPLRLGASAAQGAASKLADYYIDRAEQISPVVSLFAGTEVNVVFLEGVDLEGR